MRNQFASILIDNFCQREDFVFLTGDLGYNALEKVRDSMGTRFINAGVAEQNMVGVAAGFAKKGFKVITYSIAPFAVYRCLEQIRVDVCLHNLPVFIVGNGGGYGYGIMGGTHHAIEDIACLSCLPNMSCYVPAYFDELESAIDSMFSAEKPAYLRLGMGKENPQKKTKPSPLFGIKIVENPKVTLVGLGPSVHQCVEAAEKSEIPCDVFSAYKLPILELSHSLIQSIQKTQKLIVVEEHASRGGLAENLSLMLFNEGLNQTKVISLHANGYPNKLYGSQKYHQKINHLDLESIHNVIKSI